jgi:bisphosphoglycerate-dependent phosphoglycerate mutase
MHKKIQIQVPAHTKETKQKWAKNKLKKRRRSQDTEPPKIEEQKRNRGKGLETQAKNSGTIA